MVAALMLSLMVLAGPADVQSSHVEKNVPAPADFKRFLRRDLAGYFAQLRKKKTVPVQYELLRDGPTQTGVSYPKYYLWVRLAGGKSPADRGAVRVSAVEKKEFAITDFLTETEIREDETRLRRVFPAEVCDRIKSKLKK
jgi:hypothetical protein